MITRSHRRRLTPPRPRRAKEGRKRGPGSALLMALIFTAVVLTVSLAIFDFTSSGVRLSSKRVNEQSAVRLAEAGIEKAVWCLNNLNNASVTDAECPGKSTNLYVGETNVALGTGTFTTTISGSGSSRTITATGALTGSGGTTSKQVKAQLNTATTYVAFFYGVQVGAGGLEMNNNAEISGNVYANGSIIAGNGARVRGSAIVAGGTRINADQQTQPIQTTDFTVGTPQAQEDASQSFKAGESNFINKVSLYLKKVGNPGNATVRIATDLNGSPSTNVITTGTLNANLVTPSYGWIDVALDPNPALLQNTTYWIIFDATNNSTKYWVWGKHDNSGYGNGVGKYSGNWSNQAWNDANGDFGFKTFMGGVATKIQNLTVPKTSGNTVHANTIENSNIGTGAGAGVNTKCQTMTGTTVSGNVECGTVTASTIAGNVTAENVTRSTIAGNLTCETQSQNVVSGSTNCPTPVDPPADPPPTNLPISQANIDEWKAFAQGGGQIVGDYTVTNNVSIGPKEITGSLLMPTNNTTLTVTGTIYVRGNIDISNGSVIRCASTYGPDSCVVITDGWIHIINNGQFVGSGQAGSFVLLLTTTSCVGIPRENCTHNDAAVDIHNNATGIIFYAPNGMIHLGQNVNLTEATAFKLKLEENATITYDQGLVNTIFASGPGAAWAYQKGTYQIL